MNKINLKAKYDKYLGGIEIDGEYCIPDNNSNSNNNIILKLLFGGIIGFVNGFWGGGGGMICVPILMYIIGLPEKKAHATTLLIMLPLSIASFVVYILRGEMLWDGVLYIGGGFILGGVLGALLLKKINNFWLSLIFSVIIIVGGIKMLI